MANEDFRRLIKNRNAIISSMDQIKSYVTKFDPKSNSIRQLQARLAKLQKITDQFDELDIKIQDSTDYNDEHLSVRLQFEDDVCTLKADIEDYISKYGDTNKSTTSETTSSSHDVRLPSIPAPTFNGNLEDWSSFIDTFNAMFHCNTSLADVQRLHYLKSCLTDSAAEVIRSIPTTGDNYIIAYNTLKSRFENKSLIIQSHIRSLLQTPKIEAPSAIGLRNLHQQVVSQFHALQALDQPVEHWDAWLVTLLCSRLDSITVGEWQLSRTNKDLPKFGELERFLASRVSAYEVGNASVPTHIKLIPSKSNTPASKYIEKRALFAKPSASNPPALIKCVVCSANHKLYACDKFNAMSISERRNTVRDSGSCFNCLLKGHRVATCKFSGCTICGAKHNTKLHLSEQQSMSSNTATSVPVTNAVMFAESHNQFRDTVEFSQVMLATVVVHVLDSSGIPQSCRAVLDSGSQLNFITQAKANQFGLVSTHELLPITGVASMASSAKQLAPTIICSRFGNQQFSIDLYSLPNITSKLPSQLIDLNMLPLSNEVVSDLADPYFNKPSSIDMLLGAEIFFDLFTGEQKSISSQCILRNTIFGWVVTGKLPLSTNVKSKLSSVVMSNSSLALFTMTASISHQKEDLQAEEHFKKSVTRNSKGKFIVRIPFNQDINSLGDSRAMALRRFFGIERKLIKDSNLAIEYHRFMKEYLDLGHMELAVSKYDQPTYYLPHHAVIKANSTTTKVRVVFDGSAPSSSGLSLNDIQLKGPKIQPDIFNILIRFRMHSIALTADVEKMYRQVMVEPCDRNFQRILYRSNPADPIQDYRLCTVTYGTKSASFLATRCLKEISTLENNPSANRAILQDFYVDDLISGGATEDDCFSLHQNLLSTLNTVGFPLRKWCSNSTSLMKRLPNKHNDSAFMVHIKGNDTVSALGLTWQPRTDSFCFQVKDWYPHSKLTKRLLLSAINSVYDPIGLISPALILGKVFIQQLWTMKLDWDESLSSDLQGRWNKFYHSLQKLDDLSIPRKVLHSISAKMSIHGFCDASQLAYGACIYIRSALPNGQFESHLLTSKSRVVPLRATTIPRLELCGAVLLAELVSEVQSELKLLNLNVDQANIYLWTDSTIVLSWIIHEGQLQTYVANRIARIHDLTTPAQWLHVPTIDNPADLITRGVNADSMSQCTKWWNGPNWLSSSEDHWPSCISLPVNELPELKPIKLVLVSISKDNTLLNSFSDWTKLCRITSWLQRFIYNSKLKSENHSDRRYGPLTVHELSAAQLAWFRNAQTEFSYEFHTLQNGKPVHNKSRLKTLNPFIDQNQVIRVGGRLSNSTLSEARKFPIVLPSTHKITLMIFTHEHKRLLHIGPQGLLASIHTKFWPLRGRYTARMIVHKCVICFRHRPTTFAPLMAPLPRSRTSIGRPFTNTGVDFCGPVLVRSGIRKIVSTKSYIAVFICFSTRAIHLELVHGLTSDAFIAAFKRFIARRGYCANMYSDNGTNFVGANKEIQSYIRQINQAYHTNNNVFTSLNIQWHFNPPASPHLGGLWEAAVKSTKTHLSKVAKGALLTYDELCTLLCQIEAVLNSRPITALSSDPGDYSALTPAHFLIGGPLTQLPEPIMASEPRNKLKRWEMVKFQAQQFWNRWSKEYIPQLHKRGKWHTPKHQPKIGDLAILKDDNQPAMTWQLVRISAIHPGSDGTIRVVTIRNSAGKEFRRPVVKLAFIPSSEEEDCISI